MNSSANLTSSTEKRYRKVRCKTSHGYVVSWNIRMRKDGKWSVFGVGSARLGRAPVPSAFLPFEISNVVMSSCKPEFDNFEDAERYVRAI